MKIAEIVNNLEFGGTERLVVNLAGSLQERGHEVTVICLREAGSLASILAASGIDVVWLDKPEGPSIKVLRRLTNQLKSRKIEVVHSHNPLVHHYALAAGRLSGAKVIVNTIHGIGNLSEAIGFKERLYSLMCRLSSKIVAVCPAAYRAFEKGGVIPESRLITINNGIPLDSFLKVSSSDRHEGPVTFGIVGRLVPVKNHHSLLRAFGAVVHHHPGCRLEILGDGPLRGELERVAEQLGIADCVVFHGFGTDVPGFLRRVDISVLCSTSEGLPLGILESMAAGLPIVATDVGGLRDLVEEGECGWLCRPGDDASLTQAMLDAASVDSEQLLRMGQRAREHAVDQYSLARMTQRYEELFGEILAR